MNSRREFLGSAVTVAAAQSQPRPETIDAYCSLGVDREYDLTEERLLEAMDKGKVDRAVIAPVDRFLAVDNREGNDFILKAARRKRLIAACSANPWYGKRAVEEFRRATGKGARMLVLHPWIQGFQADDELAFPLIEAAAAAKVPVYVHTGPPGNATPWQVTGLAERFPQADLIMGHCGATDFWNDVVLAAGKFDNLFLESSMARPFLFSGYVQALGGKRGIMGSWAPLNDLEFEWEQMRKFLPGEFWPEVSGGTIRRLLEKRGPL
ncbi:MAG: amidohydrolase family protein [Bryobacteraceae bacterium]